MGYVIGANALAWIVATPLGGVLTDALSWRVGLAVPAVLALAALAAARRATPLSAVAAPSPRTGLLGVVADRRARRWLVAELAAWFGAPHRSGQRPGGPAWCAPPRSARRRTARRRASSPCHRRGGRHHGCEQHGAGGERGCLHGIPAAGHVRVLSSAGAWCTRRGPPHSARQSGCGLR